ncbi:hypothetical protein NP493_174g03063 [Ridgeia piscesae]|uniref:Inner centromere protein ARK-binding domain-containing protein n=1 Tax=Ridgeia piscesae TaxID=27915 RepID=A0AAD9P327_RIDPI|nr:hypothetical protein NP493_174g03063 [Ridgeia piscesae]
MPQEKVMALNAHCTLGRGIEKAANGKLADFKSLLDANYKWLDEILDVAKKTFARPDAELLPKTPSSKRMRTVLNKRRSRLPPPIAEEEESEDDYIPSKKKARNDNLSCPKLSSRTTVSLGHRCSNDTVQNVIEHAPSPHAIRGFGLLTVKDKVNVIEGKLDAADPSHAVSSKSPRTPVSTAAPLMSPEQTHLHSNRRSNAGQIRRSSCLSSRGHARRNIQVATTSVTKVRPIMSPRKAAVSVLGTLRTPETNRCTRSKMRTKDRLRAVLSPGGVSTDSGSATYTPVKPIRTGHPKTTTTSSSDETQKKTLSSEDTENTATCSASGTEELLKPVRTTRAAAQKYRQNNEDTETGKRPVSPEQHHGRSFSAPKRQCTAARDEHTPNKERAAVGQGDSVIADTPSPIVTAKTAMSSLHRHNRLRTTPSHNTTTVNSFIRRNTPLQSQLDIVELKRQELAAKEQQNSTRLQQRNERMQKLAEEQRNRREEKQLLAAQRRQERDRTMREMRLGMIQRSVEKSIRPSQSYTMRLREERRELREKKMAEAEQRRRQEEQTRQQKLATKEEEQRKHSELKRRQRDYEEQERQRRIAETERQRQQRQQELEQERCRIAERQRQMEAERVREEQKRQRQREEREKERIEREKQELERQREKEKKRQEELKRLREQERQKNEVRREAERKAQEEEKRLRQIIDKYNTSLQAKSTAANTSTSANTSANTSTMQASMTQANSRVLNTSYTVTTEQPVAPPKSAECSSYDMTPPVKKYTPPTSENYNIDNISSEDSTDDEGAPKKKIPSWAVGAQLKAALINQHHRSPDLDTIFGPIDPPDLNILFPNKRKPRFDKRTSSAVWHSPMYTAGGRHDSS